MDYFDWYAAYLHRTCPVADAHRNLVTEVYRRRQKGETGILNQYYKKEFRKSGVNLIFASLFLGADELESCKENGAFPNGALLKKSLEMLAVFYADMEETKGKMQLVTDKASLLRITSKRGISRRWRVGVLLYLEGLDMLEGETELLRCFYAMGVRGASLTWNVRKEPVNVLAKGCGEMTDGFKTGKDVVSAADIDASKLPPVTDKGVQALFLMEQLGIFVDCSHLSREAVWFLPVFTKKAYAATHSNAAALKGHERNLTDDAIKEIAKRGGVIGVNAHRELNDCTMQSDMRDKQRNGRAGYEIHETADNDVLCRQILYLLETAGEDHVGFGLNPGEGTLLAGYGDLPAVTAALLRWGTPVETVKKVLGGNWVRYLSELI